MVAQLADDRFGEAVLHVARGRATDVPILRVAVPSLTAPLPLSPRTFAALSPPSVSAAGLTGEQKENFHRDGFLLLKGFYSAGEMATMRSNFRDMITSHDNRPKKVSYLLTSD
jgi:hypothetical protein